MRGSAVIVGGGIGGLTAALALRRIGWNVTVLERARQDAATGAGFSLAPNAMRGLDAIGVGPGIRRIGVPTAAASAIRIPDGRYLVDTEQPPEELPLLGYERVLLHAELRAALPTECLRDGVEVQGIGLANDRPAVVIAGGELEADLVVAADGIHSTLRRQLWPNSAERFLNYSVWVGLADLNEKVGPGARRGLSGSMTIGRGRYFLVHPIGPQRVYWALGERATAPGIRSAEEREEVVARVGKWHDPIPAILGATRTNLVKRLDIHEVPELPSYVNGRVVLLGDAAHAMSPDRGQGAAQSIEDAVVLASVLDEKSDVAEALAAYETIRRPRANAIARDARRVGQSAINPGAISHTLLTTMLRSMPRKLWIEATRPEKNPVWRWQPPHVPVR